MSKVIAIAIELIYLSYTTWILYNAISGPKLSSYEKTDVSDPEAMERVLANSIGVKGEVKKTRYLFIYEQTRIHLDNVDHLGYFLEFEVCLKPEETIEYGTEIAEQLMKVFEIKSENLITGAYMDKLSK
jgi:predicted adenylyl cyclase CyaB